jgi:hypothetical protein
MAHRTLADAIRGTTGGAKFYAFEHTPAGWLAVGPGQPGPRRTDHKRKAKDRAHRKAVRAQRRHMRERS